MAKSQEKLAAELKAANKANEALKKANEALVKKAEETKAVAKKQREEKAEETKMSVRARVNAAPHHWVQVFNTGLDDGVDFSFNYEGLIFKLFSGAPVKLSQILIVHLRSCRRPKTKLKQGEAGQTVKVAGWHHNFNVVNCEAPAESETAAMTA